MDNCTVIAVTNQKGGVGKTTTAVNLGAALAKQSKNILLIDADPQGSLTVSLGVKNPDSLDVSLATVMQDVIEDRPFLPGDGIIRHPEGMDLLFRSIARVRRAINPELRIDGVLMTMVDGRTNNARDVTASLRATVGQKIRVFDTEIPHSVRAAECSQLGRSIFAHDPKGKVAEAYERLAEEVMALEERSIDRPQDEWVR